MTSAKVISMNECGSLTQHTERPNQRVIMENLWASLSVAHRHYCWLLLFHSSSQSAECGDSKKMESGWCLFTTKEAQSIQTPGSGAAWLTAHPVPMISQGRSWKSSVLSHVTGLRAEEHTRRRMTTGCQGKCNWAGGDSKAKDSIFQWCYREPGGSFAVSHITDRSDSVSIQWTANTEFTFIQSAAQRGTQRERGKRSDAGQRCFLQYCTVWICHTWFIVWRNGNKMYLCSMMSTPNAAGFLLMQHRVSDPIYCFNKTSQY